MNDADRAEMVRLIQGGLPWDNTSRRESAEEIVAELEEAGFGKDPR